MTDDEVREIAKRFRASRHANPFADPEFISDAVKVGVHYFEDGIREFLRWSDRMVEFFGEFVRPALRDIWFRMPVFARQRASEITARMPDAEAKKIIAVADLFAGLEKKPLGLLDATGKEVSLGAKEEREPLYEEKSLMLLAGVNSLAELERLLSQPLSDRDLLELSRMKDPPECQDDEGEDEPWPPEEEKPPAKKNAPAARVEPQEGASQPGKNLRGLAKVAGMREVKAFLMKDVVRAFRDPELFGRYGLSIPHGILLYGPSGCGKTYIARQLAEELGCTFIESAQSEVASVYIHGSAIRIRELFETAEKAAPSVLFIDEFEGTVPRRAGLGSHEQYKSEEVNEFLVRLNDCAQKKILVIAATNEPEKIDSAVLRAGRIDKLVYVGPPDAEARIEMLRFHLSGRLTEPQIDLQGIAPILDGYSASDIWLLVEEAAREALEHGSKISTDLLMGALGRVPPSITEEDEERYRAFCTRGI